MSGACVRLSAGTGSPDFLAEDLIVFFSPSFNGKAGF